MNKEREALLWRKLKGVNLMCDICHNRCVIAPNKVSRCFSRKNVEGKMKLLNYNVVSSISADPIEKKPLYHFYPFSNVMSVGTFGCNFSCKHCQNWEISQIDKDHTIREPYKITPEELINLAVKNDCKGVAWTYNEPTIWFEYSLDCAKLAKEKGLYTVYVTNGYITPEALEMISPYLDCFRVDLKSFDDDFYQNICGVKSAKPVYESTKLAYERGMHIECVTNIIPEFNDSNDNLKQIANWIVNELDKSIPWHITRFFPYHNLNYLPPTPIETLDNAYKIGKETGLEYIYKGNIALSEDTNCPECSLLIIDRHNRKLVNLSKDNHCTKCGYKIYIKQ